MGAVLYPASSKTVKAAAPRAYFLSATATRLLTPEKILAAGRVLNEFPEASPVRYESLGRYESFAALYRTR